MNTLRDRIEKEIEAIQQMAMIPTMLEVICRTTGMGFAAIARVTDDRWIACSVRDEINFGLQPGGELNLETTICNEIRQHQVPVVIDNVEADPVYSSHCTPKMYGFRSYISVPIKKKDGSFFGTLCAIDPNPATLNNPQTIGMFRLYSELISFHLGLSEDLDIKTRELVREQQLSEIRDQFIAVLGHDLRTPLTSIIAGSSLFSLSGFSEQDKKLVNIIKNSAVRMNELVNNILDLARGKLGTGVEVHKDCTEDLEKNIYNVINELQMVWPDRKIEAQINLNEPIRCDSNRIAQLLSNLLSNALSYGSPHHPVGIKAFSTKEVFELSVTNAGEKIPDEFIGDLFKPYQRGKSESNRDGLGLGLYIAAEIARAHEGTLEVATSENETTFTLKFRP